jgi:hypothetical protein
VRFGLGPGAAEGTFTGWRATIFNPPAGEAGPFQAEVWVICLA